MKVFKIQINDNFDETGVDAISLVEYPAIEQNFLAFSSDEGRLANLKMSLDTEKHIVSGPAMVANLPIYRNSREYGEHYVVFDKETIAAIVEKYMKSYFQNNVNIEHDDCNFTNAVMIESYFVDKERGISPKGYDLPDGSWFVSLKIKDVDTWDKIKSGELKGFSIQGLFNYGGYVEMSDEKKDSFDNYIDELVKEFNL